MLNAYIHRPSFLKGIEVGRAIKRLPRVIDPTPTGIYDDEYPIEWNALQVYDYPVKVDASEFLGDGTLLTKISNLTPDILTLKACRITATANGNTIAFWLYYFMETDIGSLVVFVTPDGEGQLIIASCTSTQPSADLGGMSLPETGLYVASYPTDDVNFTLALDDRTAFYITPDLNAADYTVVPWTFDGEPIAYLAKITDAVMTAEQIRASGFSLEMNGEIFACENIGVFVSDQSNYAGVAEEGGMAIFIFGLIIAGIVSTSVTDDTFTETGTYVLAATVNDGNINILNAVYKLA